MKFLKAAAILVLLNFAAGAVFAQSSGARTPSNKDKPEFPLWVRDLRRAEIIAFGSFPFMVFFSSFTVDTIRAANHNWDTRYAPWPMKSAGAVEMTTKEYAITFSVAITGSVLIALTDYLIVRHKRIKAEQERLKLPEGELIILRRPWPPDESAPDESPDHEEESATGGTEGGTTNEVPRGTP